MKYFNVPITLMQGVFIGTKSGIDFIEEVLLYYCYEEYLKHNKIQYFDKPVEYLGFCFSDESFFLAQELFNKHSATLTRVGIKDNWLSDFLTPRKSLFEWQVFMAYLGMKLYHLITTETMVARMFGYAKNDDFRNNSDFVLSRYRREKILAEVAINWGLLSLSSNKGIRGFYISSKLELQQLKNICDEKVSAMEKYKKMKSKLK